MNCNDELDSIEIKEFNQDVLNKYNNINVENLDELSFKYNTIYILEKNKSLKKSVLLNNTFNKYFKN